jgi:hypothetical protein
MPPPVYAGSSLADFSTLKMEAIRSPKRRFTLDLHGATSKKTAFFMVYDISRNIQYETGISPLAQCNFQTLNLILRGLIMVKKVKLSLQQAMKAHKVVTRRNSHIF